MLVFMPTPQPESQEEILAAALASLDEHDIPPDEGWTIPDPDSDPPAELSGLTGAELDELYPPTLPPDEFGPAGFLPRDGSGHGSGFADGGALDVLPPGVALAGFADDAHARLGALTDDELIGVLRGWQRQISWSQARKLDAMAELARRRPAEGSAAASPGRFPRNPSEFIPDEIALALTLTRRAAGVELSLAIDLAYLPATAATLEAGQIDLIKARIIAEGVGGLEPAHAAAVEAAGLPEAPVMTSGQLRAAVARAVLAADPDAARRDREERLTEARVECWTDPTGTASLVGRDLPSAPTLATDKRLGQIARAWRKQGAAAGLDLLRARAYLALLLGHGVDVPPADLLPAGSAPAAGYGRPAPASAAGRDNRRLPPGLPRPDLGAGAVGPLAGSVHLTVPLGTLLGLSDAPGDAAGYGPLDPDTARILACAAAGHSAARWHITVTGPGGQALAHGTVCRRARTSPGDQWTVTVTAEPITSGDCDHHNREPGYRPSPALQRLIRARTSTCTASGCRNPAVGCDLDHTIPYEEHGLTCECNLAPLCRFHHRMKQAQGWKLHQPGPGVMTWSTPAGRHYFTVPTRHPT